MAAHELDPNTTLAVLLGAQDWPSFPSTPASSNLAESCKAFSNYLRNGLGLHEGNVRDLFDDGRSPPELLKDIRSFLQNHPTSTDLILYYVGHGQPVAIGDYRLLLRYSQSHAPDGTTLSAIHLGEALGQAARKMRWFLFIDACFGPKIVQALKPPVGAAVLCASSQDAEAKGSDGAGATMFTGALLDVLRNGSTAINGPLLSLRQVAVLMNERLRSTWQSAAIGPVLDSPFENGLDLGEIPIFPNPVFKAVSVFTSTRERTTSTPVIAIVGAGFAGTATAIRLMELASSQIRLLFFERYSQQEFGGVAYGSDGILKEHCLNIHAGRISMFRERPDDFLEWASGDADKREWFKELKIPENENTAWEARFNFNESSAVPRLVYRLYLRDRFKAAEQLASKRGTVKVDRMRGDIDDLEEDDYGVRLYYTANGSHHIADVDICVLCTGQLAPLLPKFTDLVKDAPSFFRAPYDSRFLARLSSSTESDDLLIVGSGLMGYDAAQSAVEMGFKGRVTMCSRGGHRHAAYPLGHSHLILPPVFGKLFNTVRTADQMIDAIKEAVSTAPQSLFWNSFPTEFERVIPERVLKAIEPQVASFVNSAPAPEVRRFLDHWSWITTMRTSVVPEVYRRVTDAGITRVLTQNIADMTRLESGGFLVSFAGDSDHAPSEQRFSIIVTCLGYDPTYSSPSGLWGSVVRKYAIPHRKTGLGIEVGDNGKIIRRADETPSRSLYAVGTMRQGDEIQRRGRLGGFTFSIGTIRNQCLMTAISILRGVERPGIRHLASDAELRRYRSAFLDYIGQSGPARTQFNILVSRIAEGQFLPPVFARDSWLNRLKAQLFALVPTDRWLGEDSERIKHELWHYARLQAGKLVTDIRRLSERYAIVRSYRQGPGIQFEYVAEKKRCKDQLKNLMFLLGASSASLSVYLNNASLYPFVDYLRLNRFTRTAYGEANAGRLVKAFSEGVSSIELFSRVDLFPNRDITPYFRNGKLIAMVIPDYNTTSAMKPLYRETPRAYPHVLVTLVLDKQNRSILGALYLEAPKERDFKELDVERVLVELGELSPLLSRVATNWEPLRETNRENQDMTGWNLNRSEMINFILTNATLNSANLEYADLSFAVLNGAQCRDAYFKSAELRQAHMVGAIFTRSTFTNASLAGCRIIGSDFTQCDLRWAKLQGSVIESSDFTGADLTGADLSGAVLYDVTFSGASFRNAFLAHTRFESCVWDKLTFFSNCSITRSSHGALPAWIREKVRFVFLD